MRKAGDLIVVPADPHMADGGTIDWDVLRPQTREAFLDIAERVGHEAIDITYRYAHLFPAKRAQIADALSELRGE